MTVNFTAIFFGGEWFPAGAGSAVPPSWRPCPMTAPSRCGAGPGFGGGATATPQAGNTGRRRNANHTRPHDLESRTSRGVLQKQNVGVRSNIFSIVAGGVIRSSWLNIFHDPIISELLYTWGGFVCFQGFGWLVYVVYSDSLHADCREGEERRVEAPPVTARRGRRGRGRGSVRIAPPSHPLGIPRVARAGHAGLHAAAELHHGPPAAAPAVRSMSRGMGVMCADRLSMKAAHRVPTV